MGLEAAIEFLSQDAVKIRSGQKAEIYNWGGPTNIPAEVRRVEPQGFTKVSALGVEEQRTLVILQFTAPPSTWTGLAPGYRVWGRVHLRQLASATLAPLGALVRDSGNWAVYRIEQQRAHLQPVQVGVLTDRDAEVLSGLSPGDAVIVYPSDLVHDGLRVQPRAAGRTPEDFSNLSWAGTEASLPNGCSDGIGDATARLENGGARVPRDARLC
jgi:HlyD family secretion protein